MCVPIAASLAAVLALLPQDPIDSCASALLRGDHATAARHAASAATPATRARLEAALLPPGQRAAGFLAVAQAFPHSSDADHAIVAGAAAILVQRAWSDPSGSSLPELADWLDRENDPNRDWRLSWWDAPGTGAVLDGLVAALERRRAAGGDAELLATANTLLRQCVVSRYAFAPARVVPGAVWSAAGERRAALRFRAHRRAPGLGSWAELGSELPAELDLLLPRDAASALPALPVGDWLLELTTPGTPWRAVRPIEVSDVDLFGVLSHGCLAAGVWQRDHWVAQAALELRCGGEEARREHRHAAMILDPRLGGTGNVMCRVGEVTAWAALPAIGPVGTARERCRAHLQLDRPLYRPGETVHGRVLLRSSDFRGTGADMVVSSAPAAGALLSLRWSKGTPHERRLDGRCDEHGVFSFTFVLPNDLPPGELRCDIEQPEEPAAIVLTSWPARIAEFQRPAVLVATAGPVSVPHDAGTATVAVQVRWASGGPAGDLPVTAVAKSWSHPSRSERRELRTDARGEASLEVDTRNLAGAYVQIGFTVAAPDGRREEVSHTFVVTAPAARTEPAAPDPTRWQVRLRGPRSVVLGERGELIVDGPLHAPALLVVGRGSRQRLHPLQLDGNGTAKVSVEPQPDDWPWLDAIVVTSRDEDRLRLPVRRRAPTRPRVELQAEARPSGAVPIRIDAIEPGTVVTIAVVDERVFALESDRTDHPDDALRPSLPWPAVRRIASATARTPQDLLGELLQHGRVPEAGLGGSLDRGVPSGGFACPAAPAKSALRQEFRATAAFVTAIADPDGSATAELSLPDDLTTWRVTTIGVAPDGEGFRDERALRTRLPLSVTPVLPRVLRTGDRIDVPVAIDRAATLTGAAELAFAAVSAGSNLRIEEVPATVAVPAGTVQQCTLSLAASSAGPAQLELAVGNGDGADRARHQIDVRRDVVTIPAQNAARGRGRIEIAPAPGSDPDREHELVVLGAGTAVTSLLQQQLEQYPFGCVEQTLAALLPYAAALRAAAIHGEEAPPPPPGFTQRLRVGLERIRQLHHPGGGFAFWPGEAADLGMTALVLHGLAALQRGGVDLRAFGLDLQSDRSLFTSAWWRLRHGDQPVAALEAEACIAAELTAGALRLWPTHSELRATAAAIADAPALLPRGLASRLGLALRDAGDVERARRLYDAARRSAATASAGRFPGDDPVALLALQLELGCGLGVAATERDALVHDLLLQCLRRQPTTYASGCALLAFAVAIRPARAPQPIPVTVQLATGPQELVLDADNQFLVRVRVPASPKLVVTGPADKELLLQLVSERSEPAAAAAAVATPIVVERALCSRAADGELVPVGSTLPAGAVLHYRVRLSAPQWQRYVVVECPLPAGFELLDGSASVQRFDDRFAFTVPWLGRGTVERSFAVSPVMTGAVLLPPVVATAMYQTEACGRSAGGRITVVAGPSAAAVASARIVLDQPPVAAEQQGPPPLLQVVVDALWQVVEAFGDAADDLAGARLRAESAATQLDRLLPRVDPFAALPECTSCLDQVQRPVDAADEPWSEEGRDAARLRAALRARITAWHEEVVGRAIDALAADRGDVEPGQRTVVELFRALALWPDAAARERAAASVLRHLRREGELLRAALCSIDDVATTAELKLELSACLFAGDPETRRHIVGLLPQEELAAVPPTLLAHGLCDRQGDGSAQLIQWPAGVVAALAATAAGRAALLSRLQQPEFVSCQIERLLAELSFELWQQVPLSGYAGVADRQHELRWQVAEGEVELGEWLRRGPWADAALQQEFARTDLLAWRRVLASVLRARGVHALGAFTRSDDPTLELWVRLLAVDVNDAQAMLALRQELQQQMAGGGSGMGLAAESIDRCLGAIAARSAPVATLVSVAGSLDEADWHVAYARLSAAERIAVLQQVQSKLPSLPPPADLAECAALVGYGQRFGDDGVGQALLGSEPGVAFALALLVATTLADTEIVVMPPWSDLAEALGIEPATLQPPPGRPWLPALLAAQRRGFAGAWPDGRAAQLDRLRLLRGVR